MKNLLLNILGKTSLYKKQFKFHQEIEKFREKIARRQEGSLTHADIDRFYHDLNNFDFKFVLFSNYYRKYIQNLNRFRPDTAEDNPDLTFLMIALAEDQYKPTEPLPVFKYHVRYKYKLTSKYFISREKKQNHKKLNTPGFTKPDSKFDSTKKWTRVSLRNQCKPDCGCSK